MLDHELSQHSTQPHAANQVRNSLIYRAMYDDHHTYLPQCRSMDRHARIRVCTYTGNPVIILEKVRTIPLLLHVLHAFLTHDYVLCQKNHAHSLLT